eukprot:scaffold270842_cov28-Tisochrysis_lutea.AAC.2
MEPAAGSLTTECCRFVRAHLSRAGSKRCAHLYSDAQRAYLLRKAEVRNLDVSIRVKEEVFGLKITIKNV